MATFELCSCKKHGRIALKDGFQGPEFCFKEHGLHLVRTAVQFGRLSDDEVVLMTREINSSALPETAADADIVLVFDIELFNHFRAVMHEIAEFPGVFIHAALQTKTPKKLIPSDFLEKLTASISKSRPN
jgi:hypothetical protein